MVEQPVPKGLHPMEGTHGGAVHEELQPMGRTHVGEFHGELRPVGETPLGDPTLEQEKSVRKKKRQRQHLN